MQLAQIPAWMPAPDFNDDYFELYVELGFFDAAVE